MTDNDLTEDDRRVIRIEDTEAYARRGIYLAHERARAQRLADAQLRERARTFARATLRDCLIVALALVIGALALSIIVNVLAP